MDNQGWIKLHRSFADWEWFDTPGMVWLFVKCLLLANHEEKQWHGILIPRGTFITSYENLSSKKAGIGVQSIRTMIKRLISTGEITIKTTNKYTAISINNYDKYQETNKQTNKQLTNNQQTTNKQLTTNKNDKNEKILLSKDNKAYGDKAINLILLEFEKLEGHKPTDPKPRFEAFNLLRNIKTTIKEVGHKEVTEEGIVRVITAYYGWLKKQEWGSSVQNLSTVRRKFEIYKSILQRSANETN